MRSLFTIVVITLLAISVGCSGIDTSKCVEVTLDDESTPETPATNAASKPSVNEENMASVDLGDLSVITADTISRYDHPLEEMPEPTVSMRVRPLGRLDEVFNDSNYVHWQEAERIGLVPMTDTRSHWQLRRPIVKIVSCADYYVDELKYSRPYMIPEGAALLHEIGRRFRDSIQARGGGDYRIKVTSVLRTPESVARLRRVNRNATDSSVHQMGTTVDVSYARFAADNAKMPRSAEDLKNVLAEVLYVMRNEGKCWVKYERHQPCFHITVRAREQD